MRKSKIVGRLMRATLSVTLLGVMYVSGVNPDVSTIKPSSSGEIIKEEKEITALNAIPAENNFPTNNAELHTLALGLSDDLQNAKLNSKLASEQSKTKKTEKTADENFNITSLDEVSDGMVVSRKTDMNRVSRGGSLKSRERKSNEEVAKLVMNGDYGNGAERRERLEKDGYDYETIQEEIKKLTPKPKPKAKEKKQPQATGVKGGVIIQAQPHKSFKSYMAWTALSKSSPQGKLCAKAQPNPNNAIMMYNGRYLVALGKAYANFIGEEIDIVMESGQVIPAIVGDWKATNHTIDDSTTIHDGSIVEFIVSSNQEASTAVNKSGSYDVIFPGKVKEFRK